MGVEDTITLHFFDANNSSDYRGVNTDVLDTEMLADVFGTLQTTSLNNKCNNIASIKSLTSNNNPITFDCVSNDSNNKIQQNATGLMTCTSNKSDNNKTFSSNCFINCSNSCNISVVNSPINNGQLMDLNNRGNSNSNSSSSSCSNSSNGSHFSNNSSEILTNITVPGLNPPIIVKKLRAKISSPTRHGPQQCQICSKVFGNASALAKHKLTHSDERKYVCMMCSKAFKRQDHLNGHMMTHRNKKPYECKAEGCGKSYCDARSLRRHTENHHITSTTATQSDVATPVNHSPSTSAVPPSGLSLSPATASGDASSPDGATCIRTYITTETVDVGDVSYIKSISSPTSNVTSLTTSSFTNATSASLSPPLSSPIADGITGQQLDIINQIMQQSKQCGKEVSTSSALKIDVMHSIRKQKQQHQQHQQQQQQKLQEQDNLSLNRPRTWNMQTQMHQSSSNKISVSLPNEMAISELIESETNEDFNNIIQQQQQKQQQQQQEQQHQQQKQLVTSIHPHLLNIVKIDQKPVECNLCHRKFKNVPALNGHMRLHGGYFKKDIDSKKSEKKETCGPPLQTASIGVRALIEEKIISKRCKDLKGAFVVPAPPMSSRRVGIENVSTTKICVGDNQTVLKAINGGVGSNNNNRCNISSLAQDVGVVSKLNQPNVELIKRHQSIQKSTSVSVGTSTTAVTTTKGTSTDPKDSTLIELLKRGTKIAVAKRTCNGSEPQHLLTNCSRAVVIPSDMSLQSTVVAQNTTQTDPTNKTNQLISSTLNETTSDATPLSLTISQSPTGSGDIYTLTYSADAAALFDETSIYSISDTEMLLQTVNSIQLLSEADSGGSINSANNNSVHNPIEQTNQTSSLPSSSPSSISSSVCHRNQTSPKMLKDLRTLLNSPLPDNLIEFQTLHSKDLILYNNNVVSSGESIITEKSMATGMKHHSSTAVSVASSSPLLSPLAYPTPPASHETVTQSSPFIDESHHFSDTSHSFFADKCTGDFLDDPTDENIFKSTVQSSQNHLKNIDSSSIKVEDLLNESNDAECDLKDFAEQNLSFLNDDQGFLDDSRNPTSPLSESFFTGGIGTAEEVKEVLRDVLPDESISCEAMAENVIDLYYLPGMGLQSQMMSNSEDPLLSSSPKDFVHHKGGGQTMQIFQQYRQQYQQQNQQQIMFNHQTSSSANKADRQTTATVTPCYNFLPPDTSTTTAMLVQDNTKNAVQEGSTLSALLTPLPPADNISQVNLTESIPVPIQPQTFTAKPSVSSTNCDNADFPDSGVPISDKLITSSLTTIQHQANINENRQPSSLSRLHPIQTNSILKKRLRSSGTLNETSTICSKQTTYISKLRKPSRTHYTPSPMLNPDRKGTGLYSTLVKASSTNGGASGGKNSLADLIDDFDNTVEELLAFPDESQVNLGSAYQVQVPTCKISSTEDYDSEMDGDELMWEPSVDIDDKLLRRYIELSKSSAIPLGFHSEEIALQALLNAKGDTTTAVLMLLQSQSKNSFQLNWSSNEMLTFLKGLEKFGKDFYTIAKELKTKSTGECVQLYYFWKKLCVDYKETHLKFGPNSTETGQTHSTGSLESRPHVCEMPDCSASFTSKAALHGHKRIHCFGRSANQLNPSGSGIGVGSTAQVQNQQNLKDDYPCKVCGKIFTKIKSRSAHMKSHRVQENGSPTNH